MSNTVTIGHPDFPKELLSIIRDFFRNGTFTDLTIISQDGVHFLVHRAVVSACSTQLCGAHHMGGGTHLTDVHSSELGALIDFMYSGELQLCGKSVYALLQGAQSLGIHRGMELCHNFIRDFPDQFAEHVAPAEPGNQLIGGLFPITIKPEPVSYSETELNRIDVGTVSVQRGRGRPRKNSNVKRNAPRTLKRTKQDANLDGEANSDLSVCLNNAEAKLKRKSKKKSASVATDSNTWDTRNAEMPKETGNPDLDGDSTSRLRRKTGMINYRGKTQARLLDNRWLCGLCKRGFRYFSVLQFHSRRHTVNKIVHSALSGYYLNDSKARSMVASQNDSYVCVRCPKVYKTVSRAKSHVLLKHSPKLQCLSCDETFMKKPVLQRHVKKCHSKVPSLTNCKECPRRVFLHLPNLLRHTKKSHSSKKTTRGRKKALNQPARKVQLKSSSYSRAKRRQQYHQKKKKTIKKSPWKCEEGDCAEDFSNEVELTKHLDIIHPEVNHSCLICGYSNKLTANLLTHMRIKHKRKSLNVPVCEICDKPFSRRSQVVRHKFSKHRIVDPSMTLFACNYPQCKYIAVHKEGLQHHQKKHQQEKLFSCDICDKKLKTAKNVEKHKNKVHRNIRPYICDQCGMSYGEPAELRSHLARHAETKSFHCEKCPYTTHEKGNFKSHLFCRHGIKFEERMVIYECDQCDFSTDSKTRYQDHIKCHKNIRDLPCPDCGKLFVTKKCLRGHVVKVHGSKSLACQFCGYATADKSKLNIHIKVMHTHRGFKPYKCVYCDFHCATGGNCRKHVMHKHKGMEVKYEKLQHAPSEQAVVMMEPVSAEEIASLQPSYHKARLAESHITHEVRNDVPLISPTTSTPPSSSAQGPDNYVFNNQPAAALNFQGQLGFELFHTILGPNIP